MTEVSHYDAIIVLGGGINSDGSLPPIPRQRLDYAYELQQRTSTPIIVSGKWSVVASPPTRSEASAMQEYLTLLGVDRDNILTEAQSMETLGNAYFTKTTILQERHWRRLLVITSEFHIARATYLFKVALGEAYSVDFVAVPSGLSATDLTAKAKLEARLLDFYRQLLANVSPGDDEAIHAVMELFPGYTDHPKFTQLELRAIIQGQSAPDTYGLSGN